MFNFLNNEVINKGKLEKYDETMINKKKRYKIRNEVENYYRVRIIRKKRIKILRIRW